MKRTFRNSGTGIWENPSAYKKSEEAKETSKIKIMESPTVTTQDIKFTISGEPNWKCFDSNKLHKFSYKKFNQIHGRISRLFNDVLVNPEKTAINLTASTT